MRVLVADDEKLSRVSLISMLEESERDISIAGEATNGEDLLNALSKMQPDVAFVDIRMPKMNGLEAIERGRKLSPHTQWVILSGFSEFDYARKALSLGAFMYLLKPLGMEELGSVLDSLFTKIDQTYQRLDDEFEHYILAALNNGQSPGLAEFVSEARYTKHKVLLIATDTHAFPGQMEQAKRCLYRAIQEAVSGWSSLTCRVAIFTLTSGETAVAMCWQEGEPKDDLQMEVIADSIYHRINRLTDQRIAYTQVDSSIYANIGGMLAGLQDIRRLLPLRAVIGINHRFSLEELQKQPPAAAHMGLVMTKLVDDYHHHLYMDYCRELEEITTLLRTEQHSKQQIKHMRSFIQYGMNDSAELETAELTTLLTRHADKLLSDKKKLEGEPPDMISEVIYSIEQHYASNISIAQLAERLRITPNYLSSTFHKKTGTTFTKYLTRLRIHRAKELLSTTNLPVKDIALQVGYYSTRHFVKLFIESEGCYPTEYKKQARL